VTDHGKDIQDLNVKIKHARQMRHSHSSITFLMISFTLKSGAVNANASSVLFLFFIQVVTDHGKDI
jgi:hypothetical protein